MYEHITQESLQADMLAQMELVSTVEGSTADILTRGVAFALKGFYEALEGALSLAFPTREDGYPIAYAARALGIEQKAGTQAHTTLALSGRANTVIPEHTVFCTEDGLCFLLDAACRLDAGGQAVQTATAEAVGRQYNVDAGSICRLLTAVDGLQQVENSSPAVGGADPESYEELFDRLDARRKRPATSGNIAQYEAWAVACEGVSAARAVDVWNGAGTVKLILAGPHMQPVEETTRAAAAAYIETVRPAGGIKVTVVSAEAVPIQIRCVVQLNTAVTADMVKTYLHTAVSAYLESLAMTDSAILYNRIAYYLLGAEGVLDFSVLTLNDAAANIRLTAEQVPILEEIIIEEVSV